MEIKKKSLTNILDQINQSSYLLINTKTNWCGLFDRIGQEQIGCPVQMIIWLNKKFILLSF